MRKVIKKYECQKCLGSNENMTHILVKTEIILKVIFLNLFYMQEHDHNI